MPQAFDTPWPYPRWIAHRGAGKLAPENTLAAFRLGAAHGYRCFECDVKLSADGVPFLLHDATLERTTDGAGMAGEWPWDALSRLDAGAWHGRAYAGETLPTLAALTRFLRANALLLNLEIKPTPGTEAATGAAVAAAVASSWSDAAVPPLLSSFQPHALAAARAVAPHLPRALLLDTLWDGWQAAARELEVQAVITNHLRMDLTLRESLHTQRWRAMVYTVNDAVDVRRMEIAGVDGVITDALDRWAPHAQTRSPT